MSNMSVSVVIPVFNRASVVGATLRSVLDQTYPIDEVLLVDDRSTDDTAGRIEATIAGMERVRLIRLEHNLGQCGATNAGIRAAVGDYVALMDSDDTWSSDKIERQMAFLAGVGWDSSILLSCRVQAVQGETVVATVPPVLIAEGQPVGDFLFIDKGTVQSSTLLFSRAFALGVLFDEATRRHSDLGFALRWEHAGGRVAMLGEALVQWHEAGGSPRLSVEKVGTKSLVWYERHHAFMTPEARSEFLLMYIAKRGYPRSAPAGFARLVLAEARRGNINLRRWVRSVPAILYRNFLAPVLR